MTKLIYIILKLIELLFFVISGKNMSVAKCNKKYWSSAFIAISIYALIEGLRYGRMTDYWGYLRIYNSCNSLFTEGVDPLFSVLVYFFKITGLGFTFFLVLQSAFLIYACIIILKPYKKYVKYAVPLLLPLLVMNENFTRWFMACSFLLLAFDKYQQKKYFITFLFIVAAQITHNAILPLIPIVLLYPFYNKTIMPRIVVLSFFIIMTLYSNIGNATFIVTISDFLLNAGLISKDASMAAHLVHAEDLIQGEYLELGLMQNSLYVKIVNFLIWIPIIWFGYTYADNDKMRGLYNIMSLSLILTPLFSQVELLGRYMIFMNIFSVIVASAYYYYELKRKRGVRYQIALLSLFLFIYPTLSLIFNRGSNSDMLFIWDAEF